MPAHVALHLSRTIAVIVALGLSFGSADRAGAHGAAAGSVTVSHPWARATPPGASVGAAYFEIKADPSGGDKLVGASAEGLAGRAEIHTHEHEGAVMKMRQLDSLDIAAGSSIIFKPGGYHLMLIDLKAPLKEGDLVAIALQFQKAGRIALEVSVEPIGASGPHGLDHQPGQEDDHTQDHDHSHAAEPADAHDSDHKH